MSQRTTEHTLRTIVLRYDDTKPETDYEKNLVAGYVKLHDKAAELKQQRAKLLYEYQLLDDKVAEAEKQLAPITQTISAMLREAEAAVAARADDETINELSGRLSDYNSEVITASFHEPVLNVIADISEQLEKDFENYFDVVENFWQQFEEHENEDDELFENYDNYALDIVSYDDDRDAFRETAANLDFDDEHDTFIDRYNLLMDTVTKTYDEVRHIQQIISKYYDDSGLMDSSLSESVGSGETPKEQSPIYLLPPGHKQITDFKQNYGMLANSKRHTLTFGVPVDVVESGDVSLLQEIVMALQHYPKIIEKWIFAFDIEFEDSDGIKLTVDEWKGHEAPMRWFNRMSNLPCTVFFIQDLDARHYVLMADLILDGKAEVVEDGKAVSLTYEMMQELQGRLFDACWFFMLYCHNTGFDPQPYIEALMGEFDAAFTYEEVEKKYLEDIAIGIQLRTEKKVDGREETED